MSASIPSSEPHPPAKRGLGRLAALGLVAAVAIGAVVITRLSSSEGDRKEALELAQSGQFASAEPKLREAIERNPRDGEVAEALARGSVAAGSEHAESDLARWVDLAPDQAAPLKLRMEFYRSRKEREKAYLDGVRILQLLPDDIALRRAVLVEAFQAGKLAEAEDLSRQCLKLQPGDVPLLLLLAEIRRDRGDRVAAISIVDPIVKRRPRLIAALLLRASLHEEAGEPEKAIPFLRTVLKLEPSRFRGVGYRLSVALERTGQTEEARKVMAEVRRLQDTEVFREAIKSQPDNLELQVRLAGSLLHDGHDADGLALLQQVLNRDRGFRPAHAALAAYYERQGDAKRAAEHRHLAGLP